MSLTNEGAAPPPAGGADSGTARRPRGPRGASGAAPPRSPVPRRDRRLGARPRGSNLTRSTRRHTIELVSNRLLMVMLPTTRRTGRPTGRDPERTRERILAAALREFSAKGLAGARVDGIARRARINKRMLYHYFGDKQDLYREILARKLRERAASVASAPDDAADSLAFWFDIVCRDHDWVRLMQWEAL